jgi:hypothetical protein
MKYLIQIMIVIFLSACSGDIKEPEWERLYDLSKEGKEVTHVLSPLKGKIFLVVYSEPEMPFKIQYNSHMGFTYWKTSCTEPKRMEDILVRLNHKKVLRLNQSCLGDNEVLMWRTDLMGVAFLDSINLYTDNNIATLEVRQHGEFHEVATFKTKDNGLSKLRAESENIRYSL